MRRPSDWPHSAHAKGPPSDPLPMRTRGAAFVAAAFAVEALTGQPQRLHWFVDEDELPRSPEDIDPLTTLTSRLQAALDRQAWGEYSCRIAIDLRVAKHAMTIAVPYRVDLACVAAGPPPAGFWLIKPDPAPENTAEGESLPGGFFGDGIPF